MQHQNIDRFVNDVFNEVEKLIPLYMKTPEDERIAHGNCAACIIDADGRIFGKLYGTNKVRARESFRVAWTKASQVWITGIRTMEFEKKFFNEEVNDFGIEVPDFIGWEGGQPVTLKDGTKLSVGFSGIRGIYDLEIMVKAIQTVDAD